MVVVEVVAVVAGLVEEGCFATKGPFLVTPSPPFLRRSLKVVVSILLCLVLSPLLLTLAGEERSPKLLKL